MSAGAQRAQKKVLDPLEVDACEPPNVGPLEKQQMLVTAELSFAPSSACSARVEIKSNLWTFFTQPQGSAVWVLINLIGLAQSHHPDLWSLMVC